MKKTAKVFLTPQQKKHLYGSERTITEAELRAYAKCSEFWKFGGTDVAHDGIRMMELVVSTFLFDWVYDRITDPNFELDYRVKRAASLLDLQSRHQSQVVSSIIRKTILDIDTFFTIYNPMVNKPYSPPFEYQIKISNSTIPLKISGMLGTSKTKLHVISFSPYTNKHNVLNDPVINLQLYSLANSIIKGNSYSDAKYAVFYKAHELGELQMIKLKPQDYHGNTIDKITILIKQLENNWSYPITPCNYNCPFKLNCRPGTYNV